MSRTTLLYGKKRGHRQTGGGPLGRALLVAFFGFFFAAGIVFAVLLVQQVIVPQWRANHRFIGADCVVLMKRLAEGRSKGSPVYRPELLVEYEGQEAAIEAWAYVDVTRSFSPDRQAQQAILDRYEIGRLYKCWYDPDNPQAVCLARGYDWLAWMMLLVPLTFVAVGGGGLIYQFVTWSTSPERRLALVQRVTQLELFETDGPAHELPAVPREANLTNSPGTRLAYRLPISVSPGWALAATMAACLFWNGMVALFATIAVNSHLRGQPQWFLTVFVAPFALIGAALVWYSVKQLLVATGVGPTLVEISAHPLEPSGEYEVFLSQSGRLTMNALRVLLVCEEQATYLQGTNSRTETCPVFQREVFVREGFEIQHGMPFEARATLHVPPGAMHSFKSTHNEVRWKLVVQGDVRGWPNYRREFPLLVYPAGAGRA